MKRVLLIGLVVFGAVFAAGGRHVIRRIAIPGDAGWDYLTADTEGWRLYRDVGCSRESLNFRPPSGVTMIEETQS